jgi:aflatoxin B1 aldehyde reductase
MAKVKTILGTMTIGKAVDPAKMIATSPPITSLNEAKGFLNEFYQFGSNILDTARVYGSGTTEEVLGEIGVSQAEVHTKAFPPFTDANITNQLNDSLKALKRSSVDLYYLHVPDNSHPLEESLRAVNDLYRQGKFRSFGVSNYPAWQVAEIYYICDKNGWVKPTVYQGMYNAITRDVEKELFPCLRKLNIKFYAYNPLAGGFLANIYRFNDDPHAGRFSHETTAGKLYRVRYWKKEAFAALEKVAAACQKHGISTVDASIHWIYNHSELGEGDAVILGGIKKNEA